MEERWHRDVEQLAAAHPGLRLVRKGGKALIEGSITVDTPGGRVETYSIVIRYPADDPFEIPDTYDASNRFSCSGENHVESTGRLCMWLPQTAPVAQFLEEDGLLGYLEYVRQFIRLQLMYEARRKHGVTPHWPGQEWKHGNDGHKQWIIESTRKLKRTQIKSLLDAVRANLPTDSPCPCGSRRPLKKCHNHWFQKAKRAAKDPHFLKLAYQVLRSKP